MKSRVAEIAVGDVPAKTHTDEIRERNRVLIGSSFKSMCPEFLEWILAFSQRGKNPVDAMVLCEEPSEHGSIFRASLFTERYTYHIVAHPSWVTADTGHEGYLGATVTNRKERAGEDWMRGSDLADGSYSEDTWRRIMVDIISHEMVRLGK